MQARATELLDVLSRPQSDIVSPLIAALALPDLSETVTVLTRARRTDLAEALLAQTRKLAPPPTSDPARRSAAVIALLLLADKKAPTPPALLAMAIALHDALPTMVTVQPRNVLGGRSGRF
jgi:hypothetical protein